MNKSPEGNGIFREIFEKSSAAMLLINADGGIELVNDSFCKLSGYSREEVLAIKWTERLSKENANTFIDFNRQRILKDPDVPDEHEFRYFTKEGKMRYAILYAALIEQTSQTICTFVDITERKTVEEEVRITKENYQSILEYAGDIIYSMSPDGYFKYISPVIQEKLGYSPDELVGHLYNPSIHKDDLPLLQEFFKRVASEGRKLSGLEFRAIHKNGEVKWFTTSASPVKDDKGNTITIVGVGNDITARKNIESALKRSEKLLWTLFNNIPDMTWLKDSKGVFLACNDAFQKSVGKTQDDIVGKTDYDIVGYEDARFVTAMDKKVMTKNIVIKNEEKLYFSGINKELFLETIKTPVYDEKHELIGVLGIARDITSRKQMEVQLSESLTFFKESQQAGSIGSFKFFYDTKTWESSEVLDQIFGIGPDFQRTSETWLDILHPVDRKRISPELMRKIEQRKDFDAEYRIVRQSDKAIRWVHGIGKLAIDEQGNKQFVIGTVKDITARKQAEEAAFESQTKLTIALKLAHLGPWEYNISEKRFRFNDTFYALFKTDSAQMDGDLMTAEGYINRFVHPDDGPIVQDEIDRALNSRKPIYINRLEHRIIYANGEEGFVAVQIACIKDHNGKTVKMFGINQDISAAKNAEKELWNRAEELRELNAMKDKFFSIIAHDLRGPFTTILGFTELLPSLIEENEMEDVLKYAQYILDSSKMAMDLLSNLLEWSRSETGRLVFNPVKINLVEIINNAINHMASTAEQKTITLKPLPDEEISIVADPDLLSIVLRNLISNAIKFTHECGEVKVMVQQKETEWHIKVVDNGVGISESRIDKIFRFDQNESTRGTQNEKGTGLGLLLCKEFVEKHGGKIWIKSQLNQGSEFCFSLPISSADSTPSGIASL